MGENSKPTTKRTEALRTRTPRVRRVYRGAGEHAVAALRALLEGRR